MLQRPFSLKIRKYVLGFRSGRFGKMGMPLDKMEFIWLCILRKQLRNVLAIVLGIMFAAILLAEATLLPIGVDLSIFSILIYSVKKQEVLVQVFAFIPLMYMCICTLLFIQDRNVNVLLINTMAD